MLIVCHNCINFSSWGNFHSKWGNVCDLGLHLSLSFFALFGNWVSNECLWKVKLFSWLRRFVVMSVCKKLGDYYVFSNRRNELNYCVVHYNSEIHHMQNMLMFCDDNCAFLGPEMKSSMVNLAFETSGHRQHFTSFYSGMFSYSWCVFLFWRTWK